MVEPTFVPEAILLLGLIAFSAFFSGSEVALIGFSKLRRRQLLEAGHPRIAAVEKLMARPQRFLITILLGNTLINATAAVLTTHMALQVFGSSREALSAAVATGVVTFLILTFGEAVPKAYAARSTERMSLRLAPLLLWFQRILYPIVWVFDKITTGIFRLAGVKPHEAEAHIRSDEELKTLITVGAEEGVIEQEEQQMIHSVIEFADTTAKEIMVPRIDMVALPGDATLDHVRSFVLDSGFSRIPVYQGSLDNVVGVLYVKDMLTKLIEGKSQVQVKELMRDPFFVPESKKLDTLLAEMREKRTHMAIVIDEFGGTAGLLSLEDVLEEIVGEIFDEYDLRQDPIRKLDDRTAIVDAKTHVADVNAALDIAIPDNPEYDTLAGYVFTTLGRLGKEGQVVHAEGFDLVVEKVANRRILRVRIVKTESPTGPPPVGEEVAE